MALVPPSSKYGNAMIALGAAAVGWAHTGDTAETLLTSVAIPANAIGLGQLEIVTLWSFTNSGNSKSLRVRFGAANDLTGTTFLSTGQTTQAALQTYTRIANRATNSQVAFNNNQPTGFGVTTAAATTSAIDTTAGTFVVFSAQLASAGETITLESYVVRLIPAV